jgi:hypothetical protein
LFGFIKAFHKEEVIQVVNLSTFIFILIFLFQAIRLMYYRIEITTLKRESVFFGTIIFTFICLTYILSNLKFDLVYIPGFNSAFFNNINIVFLVLFSLVPILVHAFFLWRLICHYKNASILVDLEEPGEITNLGG